MPSSEQQRDVAGLATPEAAAQVHGELAGHVLALCQSEDIAKLPYDEQGKAIVDHVVGAVVAGHSRGSFDKPGQQRTYHSPAHIFSVIRQLIYLVKFTGSLIGQTRPPRVGRTSLRRLPGKAV
jgi:hypothetical protein